MILARDLILLDTGNKLGPTLRLAWASLARRQKLSYNGGLFGKDAADDTMEASLARRQKLSYNGGLFGKEAAADDTMEASLARRQKLSYKEAADDTM